MSKTNALKEIIHRNTSSIVDDCFYRIADEEKAYRYAVYDIESSDLGDIHRDDLILIIDLWDKGTDTSWIEDAADQIEALFNAANLPNEYILPTFYRISRRNVPDEDKSLIHRQLKFRIENYDLEV